MKNERAVKAAVKKILTKHGAWFFMPSMNGYGRRGVPDFIGCFKGGRAFGIETKFGGNGLSAFQSAELDAITAAGGLAFICYEDDVEAFEKTVEKYSE